MVVLCPQKPPRSCIAGVIEFPQLSADLLGRFLLLLRSPVIPFFVMVSHFPLLRFILLCKAKIPDLNTVLAWYKIIAAYLYDGARIQKTGYPIYLK
jgi:hypothetical protein